MHHNRNCWAVNDLEYLFSFLQLYLVQEQFFSMFKNLCFDAIPLTCVSFFHLSVWNTRHTYTADSFCVLRNAWANHVCCGSFTIGIQAIFMWENPKLNLLQVSLSSTSILYKMIHCYMTEVAKLLNIGVIYDNFQTFVHHKRTWIRWYRCSATFLPDNNFFYT